MTTGGADTQTLTFAINNAGTGGDLTASSVVQTQGSDLVPGKTILSVAADSGNHAPASTTITLPDSSTFAEALALLRLSFTNIEIGGYTIGNISNGKFILTSIGANEDTNLAVTITTAGIGNDLTFSTNVTTPGEDIVPRRAGSITLSLTSGDQVISLDDKTIDEVVTAIAGHFTGNVLFLVDGNTTTDVVTIESLQLGSSAEKINSITFDAGLDSNRVYS